MSKKPAPVCHPATPASAPAAAPASTSAPAVPPPPPDVSRAEKKMVLVFRSEEAVAAYERFCEVSRADGHSPEEDAVTILELFVSGNLALKGGTL